MEILLGTLARGAADRPEAGALADSLRSFGTASPDAIAAWVREAGLPAGAGVSGVSASTASVAATTPNDRDLSRG